MSDTVSDEHSGLRIPDADSDADAWVVVLDPSEVADPDRVEVNINSPEITVSQEGIDWGQAAIQEYLADMAVGSAIVDSRLPNRTVTINLGVGGDDEASYYAAKHALQQKVALIQREGGWLKRDTGIPLYADVVNATLTMLDQWGPTGFVELATLELECIPDFYGDEITLDEITGTGYIASVLQLDGVQAVIEGDHPGRCRIIVTDASNVQSGVCWGLRSRHYDPAPSAALKLDAEDLTLGTEASLGTLDGSQNTDVAQITAGTSGPLTINTLEFTSGDAVTHIGSYQVLARVQAAEDAATVQLSWAPAPGVSQLIANARWTVPGAFAWYFADLGVINLQRPPVGTAQWWGIVQAEVPSGTAAVAVDYYLLVPIDESCGLAESGTDGLIWTDGTVEVRTEGVFASGTSTRAGSGSPSTFRHVTSFGDFPRLPPSGLEGRAVELLVKTSDGDFDQASDDDIDSFTVQVKYRPSYLLPT